MLDYSDWIKNHDLVDLPLRRAEFAWSNMEMDLVMSCLYRFLVSTDWMDLFPDCVQHAFARSISDHCPLCLPLVWKIGVLLLGLN